MPKSRATEAASSRVPATGTPSNVAELARVVVQEGPGRYPEDAVRVEVADCGAAGGSSADHEDGNAPPGVAGHHPDGDAAAEGDQSEREGPGQHESAARVGPLVLHQKHGEEEEKVDSADGSADAAHVFDGGQADAGVLASAGKHADAA